jgi:hypothetical protein
MKIGKAHGTQSSSLYSANTIGAPMHPAPIEVADRTRKKNYWRTVPGKDCLLAEGDIGVPIYWRTDAPPPSITIVPMVSHLLFADRTKNLKRGGTNSSVCLAYFQANRLLTELYKQETEIR